MVTLSVNSQPLDVEPHTPLLYVLRDNLALHALVPSRQEAHDGRIQA